MKGYISDIRKVTLEIGTWLVTETNQVLFQLADQPGTFSLTNMATHFFIRDANIMLANSTNSPLATGTPSTIISAPPVEK